MTAAYKAPFVYFGGKRTVAHVVWERFGDAPVYAEPFAGSLAVLLGRPGWTPEHHGVETVNDKDGMVANAWRGILHDPEATAHHADWPANENDLHARHAWLTERRGELASRLEGDPDYFDAKVAGWWLWGMSQWIGGGFCGGDGPWVRQEVAPGDWQLVHLGNAGQGVSRQLVHLGDAGQGELDGTGESGLLSWLLALAERLRRVRVCSGEWDRILTPSAMAQSIPGPRAIFLDPPYSADRAECYSEDSFEVANHVREWAITAGRDRNHRIALCGYAGEGHDGLVAEHGWAEWGWTAHGGMSNDKGAGSGGNNERERIWFSPGCLAARQRGLFDAVAATGAGGR